MPLSCLVIGIALVEGGCIWLRPCCCDEPKTKDMMIRRWDTMTERIVNNDITSHRCSSEFWYFFLPSHCCCSPSFFLDQNKGGPLVAPDNAHGFGQIGDIDPSFDPIAKER
jgi:hypothetical protein